jgi:hypothetical protein
VNVPSAALQVQTPTAAERGGFLMAIEHHNTNHQRKARLHPAGPCQRTDTRNQSHSAQVCARNQLARVDVLNVMAFSIQTWSIEWQS